MGIEQSVNLPQDIMTPPIVLSPRERQIQQQAVDYSQIRSLADVWPIAAAKFGETIALYAPHLPESPQFSYRQLNEAIDSFATGLQVLGVAARSKAALIADNSPRWLIADAGTMKAGVVNAVRSSQADRDELLYILESSDSRALIVEDIKTLKLLGQRVYDLPIEVIILLSDEEIDDSIPVKTINFKSLLALGAANKFTPVDIGSEDLATLIYTSGTSGKPKGVMLCHRNFLYQINTFSTVFCPEPGAKVLSILPTWHSYERACEYYLFAQGATQVYTNLRNLKADFKKYQPEYMVAVPRLWESLYEGIQKQFRDQPANKQKLINRFFNWSRKHIEAKRIAENLALEIATVSPKDKILAQIRAFSLLPLHLLGDRIVYKKVREATGGKIKVIISGGGSLPKYLEDFFETVGVQILVGYGLTETAPVTNVRRPWRNLRLSSGQPLPGTEIKIVDPETRRTLPTRQPGLVLIRGPQVMLGYYKDPAATAKAIDSEGWFDSGDLGWLSAENDLTISGRAKDTIVLSNGENIEPQPIEDACLRSPYISQIMLVGQDAKYLGALIVPNIESLQTWAKAQNRRLALPDGDAGTPNPLPEISLDSDAIKALLREELNREVKQRPGYRADDRIVTFQFLLEPFSIENGLLTQTMKVRRNVVMSQYRDTIDAMFAG
jgi:long-chain acyl-CoA synthetase